MTNSYFSDTHAPFIYRNYSNYQCDDLSVDSLVNNTDDELFVDAWLSKIGKTTFNSDKHGVVGRRKNKTPGVGEVKSALRKCVAVVNKLESTQQELRNNVATFSSDDWKRKTMEISGLRDELSLLMSQFENGDVLNEIKLRLKKRSRKRFNQREKRKEVGEMRQIERKEHAEAHERIDCWLENMKDSVERAKAEENMKKDADCVLAEVTKKKSDARKQIALITSLIKLRGVREVAAMQRGEKLNSEDHSAFVKTCNKLSEMWENTMKTYGKEEQGLKIMLEQSATNDTKISKSKEKQITQEWENVLFGENYVPSNPIYWGLTVAERNFETFVAIRKSWDTFLTNQENASRIPVGWVLPNVKANNNWSDYLRT